jgi:hypothetical protein
MQVLENSNGWKLDIAIQKGAYTFTDDQIQLPQLYKIGCRMVQPSSKRRFYIRETNAGML